MIEPSLNAGRIGDVSARGTQESRSGTGRIWRIGIRLLFALYIAGLLAWLCIGLLPTISAHLAPFHRALEREAAGQGAWARLAARIADRTMLMGSGQTVVLQSLFSLLNLTLGVILVLRRPFERVPQLLALGMLGTAATFNGPSHQVFHVLGQPPSIKFLHFTFHVVSGAAYLWAVFLFPDGRFPTGRPESPAGRRLIVVGVTAALVLISWRSAFIAHPPFFVGFFGVLIPAVGMPSLTVRMRRSSSGLVRQQCRLLRGAMLPAAALGVIWAGAWIVSLGAGSAAHRAHLLDNHLEDWFPAVFALIPSTLFIGVLRFRLWDIDAVVNRTLVYGTLAGAAAAAYVAAVALAGAVAGTAAWSTILAMAAVALLVDPVRRRLEVLANRVVFGQSLTPHQALRVLTQGLERLSSGEELVELARVAVAGTRAASASLWVSVEDHLLCVASWPPSQSPRSRSVVPAGSSLSEWEDTLDADCFAPCIYQDQPLGALTITEHAGVELGRSESQLVGELSAQAGLLVHNARLAAELGEQVRALQAQTVELRRALESLVAAQDAERRRLERNLHDGAQHELLALLISLQALRPDLTDRDADEPSAALHELSELRSRVQSTGHAVEELCGGALPPELVAGGLAEALVPVVDGLRRAGFEVEVSGFSKERTSPDIEAAVYFSCVEALQNAAKHSEARLLWIHLQWDAERLEFWVNDDGIGFDPATPEASHGLGSLVERIAVVGGTLGVESAPGLGTAIRGSVPLPDPVGASRSADGGPA